MKQIFGHTATGEAIEQIMLKNETYRSRSLLLVELFNPSHGLGPRSPWYWVMTPLIHI